MRWLSRLNLFAKVLLSPVIVMVLAAVVATTTYMTMSRTIATLEHLAADEVLIEGSHDIQADLLRQLGYIRDYIISADEASLTRVDEAQANLLATVDRMMETAPDEETRTQFRTIQAEQDLYAEILKTVEAEVRSGNRDQAAAVLRLQAFPKMNTMLDQTEQIIAQVSSGADETRRALLSGAAGMQVVLPAAMLLATVIGLVVALVVARAIVKPIQRLAAAVAQVADGDLSIGELPVTGRDEVGALAMAKPLLAGRPPLLCWRPALVRFPALNSWRRGWGLCEAAARLGDL